MISPRRGWLLTVWALSVIGVLTRSLILPSPVREDGWQWVSGMMAFPVAAAFMQPASPIRGARWTRGRSAERSSWSARTDE